MEGTDCGRELIVAASDLRVHRTVFGRGSRGELPTTLVKRVGGTDATGTVDNRRPLSLKQIILAVLFATSLCCNGQLWSQGCTGSSGVNLFADGDFGSGEANIVMSNPGTAPGYRYVTRGAPADGEYTITNFTGAWSNLYSAWLSIGDNSPDEKGYMLVVNADWQPGLFYEKTIDGLCDDTDYVFSMDIINIIQPTAGGEPYIQPNVTFLFDGRAVLNTGAIPATATWKTYSFNFTTSPGQRSVKLSLRNNAAGGRGNDLALDNISFRACGPAASISKSDPIACELGNPITLTAILPPRNTGTWGIQWERSDDTGRTWTTVPNGNGTTVTHVPQRSGVTLYRYLVASSTSGITSEKCRSISQTEQVITLVPKEVIRKDSICAGTSIKIGDATYSEPGTYTTRFRSRQGCDSVITTQITVIGDETPRVTPFVRDPECMLNSNGSVKLPSTLPHSRGPYRSVVDGTSPSSPNEWTGLSPGDYTLQIADRFGCKWDTVISLSRPGPFDVELGPPQRVDLGDSINLQAYSVNGQIVRVEWIGATDDGLQGWVRPFGDTIIQVIAYNPEGCEARASLALTVLNTRSYFCPNAFTPNGDHVNDQFICYGKSQQVERILEFSVYDRWGGMMYATHDIKLGDQIRGWDGTSGGKDALAGVYVYIVKLELYGGAVEFLKGTIHLMR